MLELTRNSRRGRSQFGWIFETGIGALGTPGIVPSREPYDRFVDNNFAAFCFSSDLTAALAVSLLPQTKGRSQTGRLRSEGCQLARKPHYSKHHPPLRTSLLQSSGTVSISDKIVR